MMRPTPRQLYSTDLDRYLYTLERDDRSEDPGRMSALAGRVRDAFSTGWESWKKISVIVNFF